MTSIRSFIAFDVGEEIRATLRDIQNQLRRSNADVRWEPDDHFHVTIKFLGDVDEFILPKVIATIESTLSDIPPFNVSFESLGGFPNWRTPRVIWIGCENADGSLRRIKNILDRKLESFGFETEQREFHPHVTLGRIKSADGVQHLTPMLEKLTFEPRQRTIDGIIVMKSVLQPSGAEYTSLKLVRLRAQSQSSIH